MRRKRYSALARLPGAFSLLLRQGELHASSRSMLGAVAATLLDRALAEPGSVRLDVVLFLGPAPERWNPDSLSTSDEGGGRTSAWELSRQLVALGHRVRVFGDCTGMEGTFSGVEWLDYARFIDLSCDVLLTSTQPAAVDSIHDVRARVSILWLPESHVADLLTPALARRFDAYLCPSAAAATSLLARCPYVMARKIVCLAASGGDGFSARAREFEAIFGALLYQRRLDVVIYTGRALEPWDPDTLRAEGMAGSETMAWELARQLVGLGHRVRVFADCLGKEGLFEGVEWLDFRRFHGLTCDVLLSSREPAAVDPAHEVKAKARLLWVHDVHCGERLTPERDARTDAYLCLSGWHVACFLQHHPQVSAGKVLQIRNGIDVDEFSPHPSEVRDPVRAIYSSCPSRGLKIALDAWPQVRAAVPSATLHVYYGFQNWERRATLDGDQRALETILALKLQLENTDGVEFHGRVSPGVLAAQFRGASLWAYPNWFEETSCITAMQAQAAGLRIVTSALAALSETVGDRGVLLAQDPRSDAYRTAFTQATIAALRSEPTEAERAALRAYAARHFDLLRLAVDFVAIFRGLLARRAAAASRASSELRRVEHLAHSTRE